MGLDMYLTGRKSFFTFDEKLKRHEDGFEIGAVELKLGYWRKHPNLHGFIVQAFADGKDECQEIPLSATDLRNIISAVKDRRLPRTEGFFFGASDGSERKEDLRILERALAWVENVKQPPKIKSREIAGGELFTISTDQDFPTEYRDVIYRASW